MMLLSTWSRTNYVIILFVLLELSTLQFKATASCHNLLDDPLRVPPLPKSAWSSADRRATQFLGTRG